VRIDGPTRFGLLLAIGYVAIAWVVRFDTAYGAHNASIAYPFDTFSMYAEVPAERASAVLVRDGDGTVDRVDEFSAFECEEIVEVWRERCPPAHGAGIEYLDDDAAAYVQEHRGGGEESPTQERVEIIRRTWTIPADGSAMESEDCVIVACDVAR
jgi:hypothetical protein